MNAQCWGGGSQQRRRLSESRNCMQPVGVAESLFLCTQLLHESHKTTSLSRKCASNMESVCWSVEVDFGNFRILEKKRSLVLEAAWGPPLSCGWVYQKRPCFLLVAYLRIPPTLYDATSPGVSQTRGFFPASPSLSVGTDGVIVRLR